MCWWLAVLITGFSTQEVHAFTLASCQIAQQLSCGVHCMPFCTMPTCWWLGPGRVLGFLPIRLAISAKPSSHSNPTVLLTAQSSGPSYKPHHWQPLALCCLVWCRRSGKPCVSSCAQCQQMQTPQTSPSTSPRSVGLVRVGGVCVAQSLCW